MRAGPFPCVCGLRMCAFGGVQLARVSLGAHDGRLCPAARWGEGLLQEQEIGHRLACVCALV